MRVLIADDHRLILDSVRRALEDDGGFEVVGETQNGAQVLPLVARAPAPTSCCSTSACRTWTGSQCLDEIKRRHPEIKVVMLSASSSPDLIESALRRGASAYVLKTVDPSDLPATIRQARERHGVLDGRRRRGRRRRRGAKAAGLTERELAILSELARGLSNDEIAKELWVTQQTVKFHLTNIYRKLDVKNRTEATRVAYQLGLVESPLLDED